MDLIYNWHIIEKCNYSCKYCFSLWNSTKEIWTDDAKVLSILEGIKNSPTYPSLKTIKEFGSYSKTRINFVGGEPLLLGSKLIEIAKHAKDMGLETSIITNGSLLLKNIEIVNHMDSIGLSIDSFSTKINRAIGRCTKNNNILNIQSVYELIEMIRNINPSIDLKLNVVVNKHNFNKILVPKFMDLRPTKVKIFREMPFENNQVGITNEMFQIFKKLNQCDSLNVFYENNSDMTHSYLMIDPAGRFFQNGNNNFYTYSDPIFKVGFEEALNSIQFDSGAYLKRYIREK